ncbi:hypothetical protein VYU27_006919 [Nannochloropsis oceanica]
MSSGGPGQDTSSGDKKLMEVGVKAGEAQSCKASQNELVGAAAAGATVGMMIAGPVVAVAGGIVAGMMAANNEGQGGEVARATGRAASTAFESAKAFDKEHHMTEKLKDAAAKTMAKAQALDKEFHIVDKVKESTGKAMSQAKRMDEEHHITQKLSAARFP